MYQHSHRPSANPGGQKRRRSALMLFVVLLLTACCLPAVAQEKTNKIQRSIDAIKAAHYCLDADYHTDGQRTVWVKSYTLWVPDDLTVMKKEAPDTLKFLNQAIDHNRMDVLEQLLPDYYRNHGGVSAFAADIKKTT